MKKNILVILFVLFFVCGIHAQVHEQATVMWITTNPAADPYLCVFGNTIEDITLIDSFLDLGGKEVLYLREREAVDLHQTFRREMDRLGARFLSVHIIQRRAVERDGRFDIEVYFIVEIYERSGNRYYLIADNFY